MWALSRLVYPRSERTHRMFVDPVKIKSLDMSNNNIMNYAPLLLSCEQPRLRHLWLLHRTLNDYVQASQRLPLLALFYQMCNRLGSCRSTKYIIMIARRDAIVARHRPLSSSSYRHTAYLSATRSTAASGKRRQ